FANVHSLFFRCYPSMHPFSLPFPYTTLFRSVLWLNAVWVGMPAGPALKNSCTAGSSVWVMSHWAMPSARVLLCTVGTSVCSRPRSEEHTSELQSREHLVCRLLLE